MLFIAALLAFAIYDELILPRRHGDTLLPPLAAPQPC
jgi:uncharacterized membrane protein YobD (UPF0266 family)